MVSLQHRRIYNTFKKVLAVILLLYALTSWHDVKKHSMNVMKPGIVANGYEGGLIDDVRFIKCYVWFGNCDVVFDANDENGNLVPWHRVKKNLNDDKLYAIKLGLLYSTYLYVHLASTSRLGSVRALSDLAIARDATSIPIQVLQDINVHINSRDSSMFHDHDLKLGFWRQLFKHDITKISIKGEDWDYKGHGIWCKYSQIRDSKFENVISNMQLFLGNGFVESRPMWKEVIHEMKRGKGKQLPAISISMEILSEHGEVDNLALSNSVSFKNGELKILQLTDLHFGVEDSNYKFERIGDLRTREFINTVIGLERPDLVIITGDVLAGVHTLDYEAVFLRAVEPIIKARIPYAIAWGNDDFSKYASKGQLLSFVENLPYCLNGVSGDASLIKNIFEPKHNNTNIEITLHNKNKFIGTIFVLDSTCPKEANAFLAEAFINIKAARDELNYYSLAFQHLPIPEYRPSGSFAIIGSYNEKQPLESPQLNLRSTLEDMSIQALSCGHEHGNDCCLQSTGPMYKEEMWLCYGGRTGVSGYYIEGAAAPNVRFFRINDNTGEITSWKRGITTPARVYDYQYVYKRKSS
ncbi:LAFE_0F04258g1_1 [Lachancea fermentati]|uniref:LAFE_0F04258g1_1 n=1 Tax=Lachancea fermentati TaxID=4955 RepID=A0A1G4MEK7_LACFM|nr:LAFE_0F04258g1_1 [Lachancea fermentati]